AALRGASSDPLAAPLLPRLLPFARALSQLRLPAGQRLDEGPRPPAPDATVDYPAGAAPYLVLDEEHLRVALWPTISLLGDKPSLREGEYLYPGKELGPPKEAAALLASALSTAQAADGGLGKRLAGEAPTPDAPPANPSP